MKKIIRTLHRYLGLIFSFSILMSSGSGATSFIAYLRGKKRVV